MKKLSHRILTSFVLSFLSFTFMVSAEGAATQATGAFSSLKTIIESFSSNVLTALGSLFMGAAVVIFFFGIVQYILGARSGDAKKIGDGNQFMMWGLVGLFVMFSVYGIVKWGQDIFFGRGANITTITIPSIQFNTTGGARGGDASPLTTSCTPNKPCLRTSDGAVGTCNAAGNACN
jgi:Type IV secretion system pilin